ncbi:FAD-dependent oxidoreductase [Saccharothrix coeruleofusca]|uniref:ferredoxin--NADP(+) reductase n=1 Tax=Saccharothrix coeruleofusca TaxID=33919 RepID=A0A918APD4_9PSEU|nr:FAD-dependent oxidoreductase [Saccharothrix coeruleofusca]GGP66362.1 pyridine nucleotide-disulfide oxidoreductase [Saccharothrix coeruleofusca]
MTGAARVLVVGAGPAGLYAATALAAAEVEVDVAERLPTPFGLVRYGVAPDHPKIKSVAGVLSRPFSSPGVRFLGNVEVGVDLTPADLARHYDAVVYATGAPVGRMAGIEGEDLPGSAPAGDFVSWYSGHPDAPDLSPLLASRRVAVIGAGNVALDVVRLLVKDPASLAGTDLPDHVLAALRASAVTDVHLVARRGPAQVRFTPAELRELGELPGVDVLVAAEDVAGALAEAADGSRADRANVDILCEWARRAPGGRDRRVWLRFRRRPVRLLGPDRVSGLVVRGEREELLPVQGVLHAVGYGAVPLPGLPFDRDSGTVPHVAGRVVDPERGVLPGVYVAGWLKRGATGVIGTNKADAGETAASLLADLPGLRRAPDRDPGSVTALLSRRGVPVVTWEGWRRIEREEERLGARQGRAVAKLADLPAMLALATRPGGPRG